MMQTNNPTYGTFRGRQPKIALINDMCGFGRCSLTVSMPIISAMGIQACPVPTAVFSNHTAYESFYRQDMTAALPQYITEWSKLRLRFNAVLAGYLSSPEQIRITAEFAESFTASEGVFVLDPVMGDNGRLYSAYQSDMLERMKELVSYSDVLTPNLTEACFLTDTDYNSVLGALGKKRSDMLLKMAESLSSGMKGGCGKVVISGIETKEYIANFIYDNGTGTCLRSKKSGPSRCGTGDIFSSIITAAIVSEHTFNEAVKLAAAFIRKCITVSDDYEIPLTDGVAFEEVLYTLIDHQRIIQRRNNNHEISVQKISVKQEE